MKYSNKKKYSSLKKKFPPPKSIWMQKRNRHPKMFPSSTKMSHHKENIPPQRKCPTSRKMTHLKENDPPQGKCPTSRKMSHLNENVPLKGKCPTSTCELSAPARSFSQPWKVIMSTLVFPSTSLLIMKYSLILHLT